MEANNFILIVCFIMFILFLVPFFIFCGTFCITSSVISGCSGLEGAISEEIASELKLCSGDYNDFISEIEQDFANWSQDIVVWEEDFVNWTNEFDAAIVNWGDIFESDVKNWGKEFKKDLSSWQVDWQKWEDDIEKWANDVWNWF